MHCTLTTFPCFDALKRSAGRPTQVRFKLRRMRCDNVFIFCSTNGEGACSVWRSAIVPPAHQSLFELTLTRKTVQHCQSKECNRQEIFSKRSQMTGELLKKPPKNNKNKRHETTAGLIIAADRCASFLPLMI